MQGITLAGVLFDEVALQPESFVNQAIARTLSVGNAKLWFNCNPDSPEHWFYRQWIQKTDSGERPDILHIHFEMQDNPMMTPEKIAKTTTLYSGVFYDRYIRGLWVIAEGLVYPMFDKTKHIGVPEHLNGDYFISIDYGTMNPTSMGLWCRTYDGHAYRLKEIYYDGRKKQPRTDEEHYKALCELAEGYFIDSVIVDPSASSFIECIRRHGDFRVRKAENTVNDGIQDTATLLKMGRLHFSENCTDIIREFGLYHWDDKAQGDKVIKENDHAMDDMRYFVRIAMKRILKDLRQGGENN